MIDPEVTTYPTSIGIEASSFCQLKCPSCPTATRAIDKHVGYGFLRLDDFITLIEANPQIRHIELSNYGEIFLNPQLPAILEYAYDNAIDVTALNGVNLNNASDEALEGLVKYSVKAMAVSIDGATQESYEKYRVKGNLETVLSNIRKLNDWKKQYNAKYPKLKWQFIVFGHNQDEIEQAKSIADELEMQFYLKTSWDDEFSPIENKADLENRLGYTSREDYLEKTGTPYLQNLCRQLWHSPRINWDGKVLGCCRNFWGDFGGNAFSDGFLDAINNSKIRYARQMLNGESPPREDIPCTTCDVYLNSQAAKPYAAETAGNRGDLDPLRTESQTAPPDNKTLLNMKAPAQARVESNQASKLSIITTCKGRLEHLKQSLPRMLDQDGAEVIVVDFSCPDGTADYVEANFSDVKTLRVADRENFLQWEARNLGAKQASGQWLAFVDADTILKPAELIRTVGKLRPKAFAKFGPGSKLERHRSDYSPLSLNSLKGFLIVERQVFEELGGYDQVLEGYGAGGDVELDYRLAFFDNEPVTLSEAIVDRVIDHGDELRLRHAGLDVMESYIRGRVYFQIKRTLLGFYKTNLPPGAQQNIYAAATSLTQKLRQSPTSTLTYNFQEASVRLEPALPEIKFGVGIQVSVKLETGRPPIG
ncbi:MAG: glycosyltransferase [Pseudomonadota bacterium]